MVGTSEIVRKPISDLLSKLMEISEQTLEDKNKVRKDALLEYPLALFEVLVEIKEKTCLSDARKAVDEESEDTELMRLDNMLVAHGVAGPPDMGPPPINQNASGDDQDEYRDKLEAMKQEYSQNMLKYEQSCGEFTLHAKDLLMEQGKYRPIADKEIDRMVSVIRKKFSAIEVRLKQKTCEDVLLLHTRFRDARRKRRNFSKQATDILNHYFEAHIVNPYPSEEAKEMLARQCNITVSQVCNWFGNKRIRHKKKVAKAQEEANIYAASMPASGLQYLPGQGYGMLGGPSGMLNPYQNMDPLAHMGMGATFDLSAYNPQLVAQYHAANMDQQAQQEPK